MTFITATTMPLLIALAVIGLSDGVMIPANAAALVGAGVLSVLVYPSIAAAVARRGQAKAGAPAAVTAGGPGPDGVAGEGVVTAARVAGESGMASPASRLNHTLIPGPAGHGRSAADLARVAGPE
jgi:hypothetical protein